MFIILNFFTENVFLTMHQKKKSIKYSNITIKTLYNIMHIFYSRKNVGRYTIKEIDKFYNSGSLLFNLKSF